MIDISKDFALLKETAREAAQLAMSYWGLGIVAERKADGTPVTAADLAVDSFLAERLRTARPDYGWLSEESPDDEGRLSKRRVWILDPIDGTRDFIAGGSDWTVGLCLAQDGKPVLSVVINPVREETFEAESGRGAWLNGQQIQTSHQSDIAGARFAVAKSLFRRAVAHCGPAGPRPVQANSSLYRLALVACGRADASFALNPKWEWDIASGALLVEEAGGKVTTLSGSSLSFNSIEAKLEGFIAAAPDLHQVLSGSLRMIGAPSRASGS